MFAEAHTEEIGHRVRARRRTDEQQLLVNGKIQGGHDQHGNVQQPPGEHRDPRKAVLVVVRPAEQEHAGEDQRGQGEGHDDHFGAHPCGGDEQAAERKAEDTPADVGLERPEHGVEFPQADERKQEQQAEKVRPGKVEGGSEDAHKHGAGDDPRKMF